MPLSISNDSMMKLYEYLKEHKNYYFNKLQTFNGIKIGYIEIELFKGFKRDMLYIRIKDDNESRFLYCEQFEKFDTFEEFNDCIDILNKLKFDKLTGKFKSIIEPNFDSILKNVTVNYKECCVCLENTLMALKCDHHICYECKSQLKKNKCPMCRKDFCICDECEECKSESESDNE